MATRLSPWILGPDDGEFRWGMDGSLSRFVAPAEATGGAYAIVEDHVAGGEGIPFHHHPGDNCSSLYSQRLTSTGPCSPEHEPSSTGSPESYAE